jgi:hypothetical protein
MFWIAEEKNEYSGFKVEGPVLSNPNCSTSLQRKQMHVARSLELCTFINVQCSPSTNIIFLCYNKGFTQYCVKLCILLMNVNIKKIQMSFLSNLPE